MGERSQATPTLKGGSFRLLSDSLVRGKHGNEYQNHKTQLCAPPRAYLEGLVLLLAL